MKNIFISLCVGAMLFTALPVLAQQTNPAVTGETKSQMQQQENAFLEQAGLERLSLGAIVANVIRVALSLLGLIFVILIIYAGFMWMTSAGNEERIDKAKSTMIAATIGLAIVLAAYAITVFIVNMLTRSSGAGGGPPGSPL